ncbi:MerR family transcriptional regulator [Streptomyces sp. 8K308]|uniref:MerR family transcriptional regulator n=1 Tax=Streptomyces sp. 8K308 TaxID=2530388 RepID=UPI00104E4CB8|nr:MerR family transcriptional regulator [Streptomyces sp. 8K308]TDC24227.1 MerR family transcriptional regulator [Streptomyces sp. 8K308]
MHASEAPQAPGQYRAAELAEAAGIPERTLRYYRERRLLPPPRRVGRVAWYDESHLSRLRTIAALLARGHTLGGIAELIAAFTAGHDTERTAELLGLAEPLPQPTEPPPWAEERPLRLTRAELASYWPDGDSPENLAAAVETGYLTVAGDEIVHFSRELLEATSALVEEGLPLPVVLVAGQVLRDHAEELAGVFTEVLRAHVVPELLGHDGRDGDRHPLSAEDVERLTEALERLRPLVKRAVSAAISLAVDRRLGAKFQPPTES